MEYSLKIGHWRKLQDLELDFGVGLNWLSGKHGTGKSSVLAALQRILFNKEFGADGAQSVKTTEHHLELANGVFSLTQGKNSNDGSYFYGQIGDLALQGEYGENHARFLRHYGIAGEAQAWEILQSRVLFDAHTPTLWKMTDQKMVEWLSSVLGDDTQRIKKQFEKAKIKYKELKKQFEELEIQTSVVSGSKPVLDTEISDKLKLLYVQTVGTLRPFENVYKKQVLKDAESELCQLNSSYLTYCKITEKSIQELSLQLEGEEFDEAEVRSQRDALITQLDRLQTEIRQVSKQIVDSLICPTCESALLFVDGKLTVADVEAINNARLNVIKLKNKELNVGSQKTGLDATLALVEVKRRLEKLQDEIRSKRIGHESKKSSLEAAIAEHSEIIKRSDKVESVWQEIANLEQIQRDIKFNENRYAMFLELSRQIEPLKRRIKQYAFFCSKNGFPLFMNREFLTQASQYTRKVNDILGSLSLGKIEFEPVLDKEDHSVTGVKTYHFDPKEDDWQPYERREGSMRMILRFCAFMAQRQLSPQPIDGLQLIMIDDPPHIYDAGRLKPLLEYMLALPLVIVMAWSLDISQHIVPTQTIKL